MEKPKKRNGDRGPDKKKRKLSPNSLANLKRLPKGVVNNPYGRPATEIVEARKLNKRQIEITLRNFMDMTPDDMAGFLARPDSTNLEHIAGSIIRKAIAQGCTARLGFLLASILGSDWTVVIPPPLQESHVEKETDPKDDIVIFEVAMNENGKFKRARPQMVSASD